MKTEEKRQQIEQERKDFINGMAHELQWPLFQGRKIAQEEINLIPAYQEHPLVQQAVQELKSYLPKIQKGEKQKHPAR